MKNIFLLLLISSAITLRGDARHLRHKSKHHVHKRNDPLLEALFNDIEPKPAPKLPRGSEDDAEPLEKEQVNATQTEQDVSRSFIPQAPVQFAAPQVQSAPAEETKKSMMPIAYEARASSFPLHLHKHILLPSKNSVILPDSDEDFRKKSEIPHLHYQYTSNFMPNDVHADEPQKMVSLPKDTMPEPIITPIEKAKTGKTLKEEPTPFKGMKPKKNVEEGKCNDMFDSCPDMAKNEYCTKYPSLMKIQCPVACKMCDSDSTGSGSGSGDEIEEELDDESSSDDEPPSDDAVKDSEPEPKEAESSSESSGSAAEEAPQKEEGSAKEEAPKPKPVNDDVASGGESDEDISGSGSGSGSGLGEQCVDMYNTCPEFAKNEYCGKYPDLMGVQCRKSCKFCESPDMDEEEESSATAPASGTGSGSGLEASGFSDVTSGALPVLATASGSGEEEESVPAEPSPEDEEELDSSSGSSLGSGSAEGLAEDLATGEVSTEKKEPAPDAPAPAPASPPAFPKIDLKSIARAISMYRQAAIQMMGESSTKPSATVEEKKSSIPKPQAVPQLQEYIKKAQMEANRPAPGTAAFMSAPFLTSQLYKTENFARSNIPSAPHVKKTNIPMSTDPYKYVYQSTSDSSMEPMYAKLMEEHLSFSRPLELHHISPVTKKHHIPAKPAAAAPVNNVPQAQFASFQAAPVMQQAMQQVPAQQFAAAQPVAPQQFATNMQLPEMQSDFVPIVAKSKIPEQPKNITVPAFNAGDAQNYPHQVQGDQAAIRELRSFFEEEDD